MNYNAIKTGVLILLSGALMAACTAQPAPEDPNSVNGMVLRATMPDGVTKTTLSEDYQVLWQTGDKVSVNGKLSNAVASADNGKKAVEFTIDGTLNAPYKVLYPGTTSSNVISLPATQNYVAGSFDPAAAASFGNARKSGDAFIASLTHFCGILRFALNGSATLSKIELNSLGGEKLYGDFTLATGSDGFTGSWTGGTAGKLTYSFGSGLALGSSDTPIYVAIPAQAYASGIEVLVYQQDGAYMRLKFWGSGNSLGANDLIEFESKTFAAGRTENLLEIGGLTAEDGGTPTLTPPTITVASFNTMRMEDEDRPAGAITPSEADIKKGALRRPADAIRRTNTNMQAALGLAIYNMAADVIGFNEIGNDSYSTSRPYSIQNMASAQGVSGYTWNLDWKSGDSYKYCNGFAYRSSVLSLDNSGKVWLNEGSAIYNTSDINPGSPKRTVVWCLFTHISSGKQFYFFVTQLPTKDQTTANTNMSGGVNAFAASKGTSLPKILVGDTNNCEHASNLNTAGYSKLKEYWTDAWEVMDAAKGADWYYHNYPGTQSGTGQTYHYSVAQFTKNHGERRLDHIMVRNGSSGSAVVQSYRTIRNTYTVHSDGDDGIPDTEDDYDVTCAPSDHLPIVCEITLE